jgi:hypothetical protein
MIPSELLALNNEDFAKVVDQELRNRLDPETKKALADPVVIDRWWTGLTEMLIRSVVMVEAHDAEAEADQIEQTLKQDIEAARRVQVDQLRVRAKALRFQAILRPRLAGVDHLRRRLTGRIRLVALEEAIGDHRRAKVKGDAAVPPP